MLKSEYINLWSITYLQTGLSGDKKKHVVQAVRHQLNCGGYSSWLSAISVLLLCYCCCQSSLQLEFTQEPLLWRMFCVGNSYYRMQQLQNIHQTDFSLCGVVESFQTVSRSNAVCAQ